jgi:hypothetical protein
MSIVFAKLLKICEFAIGEPCQGGGDPSVGCASLRMTGLVCVIPVPSFQTLPTLSFRAGEAVAEKSCDFSRFFLNAFYNIPAVACGKDFSTHSVW